MANFYARYNGGLFGGGGGGGGAAPYSGTKSLASGVSTASVTFSTALASTPSVVAMLSSGSTANIIAVQGYSISTTGFSVQLSTSTPDNSYVLNWIASVAND